MPTIIYDHRYIEDRAEHNMVHALVILAFVAITGDEIPSIFFENYVSQQYPFIPNSWRSLLFRVCTTDLNKRLDIDKALQFLVDDVGFERFQKVDRLIQRRRRGSSTAPPARTA